MSKTWKAATIGALMASAMGTAGCCHHRAWCRPQACQTPCEPCGCETACEPACDPCGSACAPRCRTRWLDNIVLHCCGKLHRKSGAIPDTLPLGSTVRAHYQVMETNAEATDFVFHQHDFVGETAELTSDGKDKLMEIHARMNAQPFPVIVERTTNNADPELDALRRNLIAQILTDFGHYDAQQRTVVSTTYGPGFTSNQAEQTYTRHIFNGAGGNNNNFGNGGIGGGAGNGGGFF